MDNKFWRTEIYWIMIVAAAVLFVQPVRSQSLHREVKSKGMPMYPYFQTVTQPDGTEIRLSGRGDRMVHWYETPDNFTVLKNKAGYYVYAVKDDEGDLRPSSIVVEPEVSGAEAGVTKATGFSNRQLSVQKEAYLKDADVKANPSPFPSTGTNNVLVILVDFQDRTHTHPLDDIEALMNQPGYNGIGSFRDYYLDMSYSQLELNSTVTSWVTVSQNMSYYGNNDEFGYDLRPQELVREAVDLAEAAGTDFSQFDNDGDGYIDDLILFHAGYGEQYPGAGDSCIWSHAFHLGDLSVEYDGVRIDNYLICPELYGFEGTDLTSIGTVVHEFAHSLALPDMNDEDYEGTGGYAFDLNFWDLMSVGSWNNEGATPAGINSWLKKYMGWMTIPEIEATGTYTLRSAVDHQDAFQLNTPVYNEFFILENRQQVGFDAFIPGNGMLIYHVDLNYPGWLIGNVNIDPAHQGFDLEEADDIRDTISIPGDVFPGTAGITEFNGNTSPGSNTWNGASSNVAIQNISLVDGVITFDISGTNYDALPAGWGVEPLTYTNQGRLFSRVLVDGDTVSSGYLSAFINGECRGVAPITLNTGNGDYFFELLVYSNAAAGEAISFKYYDPAADSIYELYETFVFSADTIAGTLPEPVALHNPVAFVKNFQTGWNWFSLNVETADMSPGNMMTYCTASGDYIKNQTRSTTYYAGYGWFGTLNTLSSSELYLIKAGSACGMNLSGVAVDPSSKNITLVPGWNWVSYIPQVSLTPGEALASLSPTNLDYIKNQTTSATYYQGYGWFGTLSTMKPGEGYMIRLAAGDVLTYPTVTPSVKKAVEDPTLTETVHPFNPNLYEFNGSVTARLLIDGVSAAEEGDMLYAWSDGRCRGAVEARYFGLTGETVFPLMIFSNSSDGEELSFSYYNSRTKQEIACLETVTFTKDMVLADAAGPFDLNLSESTTGIGKVLFQGTTIEAWPNPFKNQVQISWNLVESSYLKIEVFDLYGKRIDILYDGNCDSGTHTFEWSVPGPAAEAYLVKMISGGTVITKHIIHID